MLICALLIVLIYVFHGQGSSPKSRLSGFICTLEEWTVLAPSMRWQWD